jgi:anti-anti-sigma factor
MALDITYTDHEPDVCVFHLAGRLDATEAPVAYDKMIDHLGERSKVILDLDSVDYVSSGGLSIIIRLVHHLRNAGGDLHLASPQPFVQRVFDIVSFNAILKVFNDVDSALGAF